MSQPALLQGIDATKYLLRFLLDPLEAAKRMHGRFGSFVILRSPFQFVKFQRKLVVLAVGAEFNREILSDLSKWRTITIGPGGPRNSASRRLGKGIFTVQGHEHEHLRRQLLPPLRRKSINGRGAELANLAADEVESWPLNEPIDLWEHSRRMLQTLAIGMFFGNDRARGVPIAETNCRWMTSTWSLKVNLCPVNLAGTPFNRMLRDAESLEQGILDWIAAAGSEFDGNDFLSILATGPGPWDKPRTASNIAEQIPSLLLASIETCQDALIWTLVLLDQHPQIARDLLDELQGRLAGALPSLDRIADLPLLDAVIKESMRLLPPAPQQFRVALEDVTLAGFPLPRRTAVVLSPFLTNRNPDLYPDPDRFKPERWARIDPSSYEYFVFSGGPRICPGSSFAFAALKASIASILTRCRVCISPGTRIDYRVSVTLSPRRGIPATLHRQDSAFAAAPIRGRIRDLVQFPS